MSILDRIFTAAGYLAAIFLAMIAVVILAQIGGRLAGYSVPDGDDLAGWCMAASSFLALAATLRRGEHIRVSLLTDRMRPARRRLFEIWAHLVGGAIGVYFAVHSVLFVLESYEFGDRSMGVLAVPLWIPQSGMAVGVVLIAVALLDELIRLLRGGDLRQSVEAARTE
ncbi:TRAP transporter small permease [Azospirillum thermophilum]|uniref:TRAP transporter small permease protein n=1 Tax=Azospirillum thermophilum TaxID=2202148 RepID=A0A2S2CUU0_9PROT|nr:TRAP transporter small permease [Azospirillum thermophilum]AWK88140.1 TRAP transporter small permease [Azospirillum thermophilum]